MGHHHAAGVQRGHSDIMTGVPLKVIWELVNLRWQGFVCQHSLSLLLFNLH
jgi:hypothetical protein